MESFGDDVTETLAKKNAASANARFGRAVANRQAATAKRFQDPLGLQLLKRAVERGRVDGQLLAQNSDAGQELSRAERFVCDGKFDLPNDLLVDRDAIAWVD
ncbi:MAG: hypothetical protein Aurels2KO_17690 [Aureliella sp.]